MEKLANYLKGRVKQAFAAEIGVSASYLSQILSGSKKPKLPLALRIEKATGGEVTVYDWVDKG